MPIAEGARGSTWVTAEDLAVLYPELALTDETMRQRCCEEAEDKLKDRLRGTWDVDSEDWSPENIGTTAPSVLRAAGKLAGALVYRGQFGKRAAGSAGMLATGAEMEAQVWAEMEVLIEKGCLPYGRRAYHPDFADKEYTNATDTDPVFDLNDPTSWPARMNNDDEDLRDDELYDD